MYHNELLNPSTAYMLYKPIKVSLVENCLLQHPKQNCAALYTAHINTLLQLLIKTIANFVGLHD